MEVLIVEMKENVVKVETDLGCFIGIWCSSMPEIFKKYIVELDCDDVLTFDDVEFSNSSFSQIEYIGKTIYLTGFVEEIQDNVLFLRLQKFLLMLELSDGLNFEQYLERYIKVKLRNLYLYDTGIRQGPVDRDKTGDG